MFKALMKKQMLELNTVWFKNKKTGKLRTKGQTAGMIVLFVFLFLLLAGCFFGVAAMMASSMLPMGFGWLYFAIMGMLALFFGVFGGVFNTYAALYHAKDNEMLLAMPIKPVYILAARLIGVYLMGLLYEAIVFVPALVAYFIIGTPTAISVINCVLLLLILGVLVLVLTCALGWVVALIASKLKNKSFITVILSLVLFAVYYYFCFNYYEALERMLQNVDNVSMSVRNAAWPMYMMGRGAMGDGVGLLVFTLLTAALFALTCWVMSSTFIKIATRNDGAAKVEYKEKKAKVTKADKALLRREFKRFSASPVYMLNCALGTVILLAAAVAVIVMREKIVGFLDTFAEFVPMETVQFLGAMAACVLSTMNDLTAPSVSLEGKSIWIVQTMPVKAQAVLDAKQKLHWYLTMPPAVLLSLAVSFVLKEDFMTAAFSAVLAVSFVELSAAAGLALNLKRPNLNWSSETVPVKQSGATAIAIFGGWAAALILGAAGCLALKYTTPDVVLVGVILVLTFAARGINKWLKSSGAEIFASL